MCSAPNVYMFVYILIGTHMVPLKRLSLKILNCSSNQQTAKSKFWLALYSEDCEVTSLFMSVDVQISTDHV